MYYDTPNVSGYIRVVKRYRVAILLLYVFLGIVAALSFKPQFITNDALLWLDESKEYQRTLSKDIATQYVSRLTIHTRTFDDSVKEKLVRIGEELGKLPGVNRVDSLFSASHIYNRKENADSEMVYTLSMSKLSAEDLKKLLHGSATPYLPYVNDRFDEFTFMIYSERPISLERVSIPFGHSFASTEEAPLAWTALLLYAALGIFVVALLFRMVFKNFVSVIAILSIIALTLIGTFTTVWLFTGTSKIYIALTLLVSAIAVIDTLYFYYRWHVAHYKADNERALLKSINRNLVPAFWTSVITLLGLGSLLWVDSEIVHLLSLAIIFASLWGYLLNITFLPAFLSYFSVSHPKVEFGRYGYYFAKNEIHYNKNYLALFLGATTLIAALGAYVFLTHPGRLFAHSVNDHVIVAKIPYSDLDLKTVTALRDFEEELKDANTGIGEIESISTALSLLNEANTGSKTCNSQNLMQALFFLELYDLEKNYADDGMLNVTIHLDHADKIAVMQWLQGYDKFDIYFADYDTLISSAKIDKTVMLGISVVTVLLIIGIIIGRIFRQKHLVWVGFIANAIPIIWFGLFLELSHIPLGLEVLIAMTLSVGLSSDATVHFAFKYFRSRFFGKTQRHALEIMFFYAGIPVVIGSLVLIAVFALLTLTPVASLQQIGGFGSILMFLSLLTDLFILPVLLLSIDPFKDHQDTIAA